MKMFGLEMKTKSVFSIRGLGTTSSVLVGASLAISACICQALASEVEGQIDSPLIGAKRDFDEKNEPGVVWFLDALKNYSDSGISVSGQPVAVLDFRDTLLIRIFGVSRVVGEREFVRLNTSLQIRPHRFRLNPKTRVMTTYNLVSIKKTGDSPYFKNLPVGHEMVAEVGNMPCDLILDALTISFAIEDEREKVLDEAINPKILLPHLGEQYGAGFLSKAVAWRLVDREIGWPEGSKGEDITIAVADQLRRQCLNSPIHLQHGWCLLNLRKLDEVAQLEEVTAILKSVESEAKGVPEWLRNRTTEQNAAEVPATAGESK